VRLAVGPGGSVCFVRDSGAVGCFTSSGKITSLKGNAKEIAIGADGTMYVLGGKGRGGDGTVWRRENNRWVKVPGRKGVRIAVGGDGNPWIVD